MVTKEHLHELIDTLPESEIRAAERYLMYLRDCAKDPVLEAFLNAPEDDESLTLEEEAAIEEGMKDIERGDVVPWEEIERKYFGDAQ